MSTYYVGKRAQRYNARWRTYSEKTLAETLAMIDVPALRGVPARLERAARVLDAACGTGLLLQRLLVQVPGIDAYGVDASEDMLAQARIALSSQTRAHLERAEIGPSATAGLPYAPGTFDLITCTNVLHDLPDAQAVLLGLHQLLAPRGQLVVEDFAPREPLFLWAVFEWLLRRIERNPVHAFTLDEVQSLCERVGLQAAAGKAFAVDWFWRGWVVRTYRE